MSKEERKETAERLAEKFALLTDSGKSFISGYIARAEEENARKNKCRPNEGLTQEKCTTSTT